jgi:spore maturation protein B
MNTVFALVVPCIMAFVAVFAMCKNVNVYSALIDGGSEGLGVIIKILPPVIALMSGVYMMRASGALDVITNLAAPILTFFGIPKETAPLIFIRPLSGSGALAVGAEIIQQYGADSIIGRTTAVMLGSTETTFYAIAVYFGAAKIKRTRYAVPAALCADITGFITASLTSRLFWG